MNDAIWTARETVTETRAAWRLGMATPAQVFAAVAALETAKRGVVARPAIYVDHAFATARCCGRAAKQAAGCTCMLVTSCPDHGTRHHGTHD